MGDREGRINDEITIGNIAAIHRAGVQQAQTGMEIGAEQLYWQTWAQSDDSAGTCRPICRRLEIPMGPGQEAPDSGTAGHGPVPSSAHGIGYWVQIRLRFMPQAGEQGLELELEPTPKEDTASELTLTYQRQASPEGMARVDTHAVKPLS